ncbi:HD domain-containing phosphohydrolase, partial [Macellibacteroides fermentans]|uniref:HD domain-containing phosphohydrolase n=1 Tax=Macellibacteroides fermentans TaxID=879969 RepID=UPI00406CF221
LFLKIQALCIIEEDMTIKQVNKEWKKSFGYTKENLIGTRWSDLFYDSHEIIEHHSLRRMNLSGTSKSFKARLNDNTEKSRDCLVTLDFIPGSNQFVANHIDLSEINRISRALKTMSSVNTALLRADNEQVLLNNVCKKIIDTGNYRMAWVGYVNKDNKMVNPIAYAGAEKGYLNSLKISLEDPQRGNGPAGIALKTGIPFICHNIEIDPLFSPWRKEALKRGFKSCISIPLHTISNDYGGVLTIYSEETSSFDINEVQLLSEMASELAYGIRAIRTRNERDIAIKNMKLNLIKMHNVFQQTVNSLSTSLETRDPYTSGHQKRVAWLAAEIATDMKLPFSQIEGLTVASLLHDIGKINVPNEILCKPGKLSEIEFALIKEHSQAGFNILKDIEFPWPIKEIILQHHERIDGSGYPQGLTGDNILLEAKILAVADVVETMSSHRPYRVALGIDQALEEISINKGILYDSEVVASCIKIFKEKGLTFESMSLENLKMLPEDTSKYTKGEEIYDI